MLLGTGMHPFMDPQRETRLWPHGYADIYKAFDRLFNCSRHGWANLQSVHVNLPFANDEEFGRLHAAIRLVLPLIPAIAGSSPLAEGRLSGFYDTRMEAYRSNSDTIASIAGDIIPEPVFSEEEYQEKILKPIFRDLAPFDHEGILQEEWINGRGAIARFERNTIEIRSIDTQEAPQADLAVAAAVIGAVKLLAEEKISPPTAQKAWQVEPLKRIPLETIKSGEETVIADAGYLRTLGASGTACSAGGLWKHLIQQIEKHEPALIEPHREELEKILTRGTLSTRIINALGNDISRKKIDEVYRKLSDCLKHGVLL
jgi:gamma-glutamyl:cysteine ligase YbdK (ATP-grasp superfamily)